MKSIVIMSAGLFLLIAFSGALASADTKVVSCEGKYVMGDLDSKKDARALALMEAKRLALEQAGTYLESTSEVKNYELTHDEINSVASGIMSVEVLKEEWEMSGENLMVTVLVRATVDTSNLGERISALKDDKESIEELKNIQTQLAAVQKELDELKSQQAQLASEGPSETSKKELKEQYVAGLNRMRALDYLRSANADMSSGRWEKAVAVYDQALIINPEMAEAYVGQAMALNQAGKRHEALIRIDKALKLQPDSAQAHGARALILSNMGEYSLALKSINEAIKRDPQNPKPYRVRGGIYLELQRPHLAFNDFDRACKMGDGKGCERAKALAQRSKTTQKQKPHRPPLVPRRRR